MLICLENYFIITVRFFLDILLRILINEIAFIFGFHIKWLFHGFHSLKPCYSFDRKEIRIIGFEWTAPELRGVKISRGAICKMQVCQPIEMKIAGFKVDFSSSWEFQKIKKNKNLIKLNYVRRISFINFRSHLLQFQYKRQHQTCFVDYNGKLKNRSVFELG